MRPRSNWKDAVDSSVHNLFPRRLPSHMTLKAACSSGCTDKNACFFFFYRFETFNCLPSTATQCRYLSAICRYGILLVSPGDKIIACAAFPLLNIRVSDNHFFKTPTKCALYILHIFFTKPLLHASVC